MTAAFSVAEKPCIPARTSHGHEMLSLRQLLTRAHRVEDLALPLPPAQSSLLRILTVITARLTGLDDPHLPRATWTRRRNELLQAGRGFDLDTIGTYLKAHVFDLFDPHRPFLQDPRLRTQCVKRAGVNALAWGRPAGNNTVWRTGDHSDSTPHPLPAHEAFWHLLIHHYYGPSGRCSARTVPGFHPVKDPGLSSGPLRSTLSFHPQGRTLYETLLLHLTPSPGDTEDLDEPACTPDACPWEEDLPDLLAPPPPLTWPGRILTGRSRHAVLLEPDPAGAHVTDAYLTWATFHPRQPATDPHHIIDTQPGKDAEQRDIPRRADADRAPWRDLDALLLAGDETRGSRRPTVFATLNDLPDTVQDHLRVRVCGFDQDPKVNNRLWYTALTPPLWNWAQSNDPRAAARIASARIAAESYAALLAKLTTTAWQSTLNPRNNDTRPARHRRTKPCRWTRAALAAYWPAAEITFWELIHTEAPGDDICPAFARTAVAALRTATRDDLICHPHAGRALARAVITLRAAASDRPRTPGERRGHP